MRTAHFILLLLLVAGLLAGCDAADMQEDLRATEEVVVQQETSKWDLFFAASKDLAAIDPLFAADFVNVGYGPGGVTRTTKAEMMQSLPFFPALPKGSFSIADMQVIRPRDGTLVLSYRVSGPGPNGPWNAYAVSTWALRGDRWETVFYQATELIAPASGVASS